MRKHVHLVLGRLKMQLRCDGNLVVAYFELKTANFKLKTAYFEFKNAYFEFEDC